MRTRIPGVSDCCIGASSSVADADVQAMVNKTSAPHKLLGMLSKAVFLGLIMGDRNKS